MSKILITGSVDGLGQLAARQLIEAGHEVVLHARDEGRGEQAKQEVPDASGLLIGDLSETDQTKALAEKANALGVFDAVVHNAGVYQSGAQQLLHFNTLAPYILTALMHRPKRLIYLSSGMHLSGKPQWTNTPAYADTKLHNLMLAKIIVRKWPEVYANAVDPGWVPTKMGGAGAPDDLEQGYATQVWLATSNDPAVKISGQYFHHRQIARSHTSADDISLQEELLVACARITGVTL